MSSAVRTAPLPIAFAADANFSVPLAIAVESLLQNAHAGTRYDIHVLDDGVLDFVKRHLDSLHNCYYFDITYHSVREMVKDMPSTHYFHRSTFARFLIASLLRKHHYSRVFYSDADVLFCGDISDVYETDMQGHALAAIQELGCLQANHSHNMLASDTCYVQAWARNFGISPDEHGGAYFNAGNFLMDCQLFEKRRYGEKSMKLSLGISPAQAPFLDQDIMNAVCWGDIALLPVKYCVIPLNEEYYACKDYDAMYRGKCLYRQDELRAVLDSPAIVHFAGQKPRVLEGPRYIHEDKFISFWKQSAWRNYMPYSPRIGSLSPSRFIQPNTPIKQYIGELRKQLIKYTVASYLFTGERRKRYAMQRDGLRTVLRNAKACC